MRPFERAPLATASFVAIALLAASALGGCSVIDSIRPGGGKASKARAEATSDEKPVDVRRYIGPNYCPELRVFEGAQLIRTYERGHQGDQGHVIWQASIGKTARECLYDTQGNLTLKVGIFGRTVAGPKGGADTVSLPIKIIVAKYKEAALATERFTLSVQIPPQGSAVFTQVKEITVPSPGEKRDYIIYIGFDVEDWDPFKPVTPAVAAADEEDEIADEPPPPPPPPQPKKPKTPNELPVPSGGFVLTQ